MSRPFGSIRRRLARRLSVMIDWRVRQAFEAERTIILDTNRTVGEISSILNDKVAALEATLIDLRRQVEELNQQQ